MEVVIKLKDLLRHPLEDGDERGTAPESDGELEFLAPSELINCLSGAFSSFLGSSTWRSNASSSALVAFSLEFFVSH